MIPRTDLFDHHATFDPADDFSVFARSISTRGAVCLLCDAEDRPIQLLSVADLRRCLQTRLGPSPEDEPETRRIDYRAMVRRLHWRPVDGAFEADLVFLDIARTLFPDTYQGMVGFKPAWWLYVNPETDFPRYMRLTDPSHKAGRVLGPLRDKQAAARLIELTENLFDLCRYYQILVEAPHGKACAYKEMGKCPAPCDGSISIEAYRRMIDWSAQSLADPRGYVMELERRMGQAAGELRFETAGKIKSLLEEANPLGKGPYRQVRALEDFVFLTLQPGYRKQTAKAFLISQGHVREILGLLQAPQSEVLLPAARRALETLPAQNPEGNVAAEHMAMVAHHLFTKRTQGRFLHRDDWNEKSILSLWRRVVRR